MDFKQNIIEVIVASVIFDLIINQLILQPFLKRQVKKGRGKRYNWGIYLTVLGGILTTLGLVGTVLTIISQGWAFPTTLIAGIAPFLIVGIPSLIFGIFLINNP